MTGNYDSGRCKPVKRCTCAAAPRIHSGTSRTGPLRLLASFMPGEMMEHYFVAGGIPLPDEHIPDSVDAQRQAQQAEQILLLAADVGMVVYAS
jgi:hypothetical protein